MSVNETIRLGNKPIIVRKSKYSTEQDFNLAIKDIERVLSVLASNSIDDIIIILEPYRLTYAKNNYRYRNNKENNKW